MPFVTASTACLGTIKVAPVSVDNFTGELRGVFVIENAEIDKVIFHDPATIILWKDGTKTVVKCQPGDTFDPKVGFLLCIMKKYFGNKGRYNNIMKEYAPMDFLATKKVKPINIIHCAACNGVVQCGAKED